MFFIAIGAPILWAVVNHTDKYLLSKYFKVSGVSSLMIFSTLFAVFLLPILYFINPLIIDVSGSYATILIISGCISSFSLYLYMKSLEKEDTSQVVPFFQLIPVFGYILSSIFLHEVLTMGQLFSIALITVGAALLSLDLNSERGVRIKWSLIGMMVTSAALVAIQRTVFKYVAIEESYLLSTFWENVGVLLFGVVLFMNPVARKGFLSIFRKNSVPIISINCLSEALTIFGNLLFSYATLLAPLTLVLAIEGYQPLIVLLFGYILTRIRPDLISENVQKGILAQRIVAIILMLVGGYLGYF